MMVCNIGIHYLTFHGHSQMHRFIVAVTIILNTLHHRHLINIHHIIILANDGADYPDTLHHVTVPIISVEKCNKPENYNGEILDGMMCAGYLQGGKDACQVE